MQSRLLSISKAAKYLNVSVNTLRNWHEQRRLLPTRTPGGQRRYSQSQLAEFKGDLTPDSMTGRIPKSGITAAVYVGLGMLSTLLFVFVWLPVQTGKQLIYTESKDLKLEGSSKILDSTLNSMQLELYKLTDKIRPIDLEEGPPVSDQLEQLDTNVRFASSDIPSSKIEDSEIFISNKAEELEVNSRDSLTNNESTLDWNNYKWLNSGAVRLTAGQTRVRVLFDAPIYTNEKRDPVVTVTPLSAVDLKWYRVSQINNGGFVIEIGHVVKEDVVFNWIAVRE